MRLFLALMGLGAMVSLAAPAYGDPDDGPGGDDVGFISALHKADIGFTNPGQAIGSARAVCTCLNNGESGLELVHDVQTHNPAFNMDAAAAFAVISAKYYCPSQLSKS
jgi:hypothetical protein